MLRLLALALASLFVPAQTPNEDRPTRHVPLKPATRQELDRLEALHLYAQGAIQQRRNRLLEALSLYEAARRLDPDSPSLHRALIPIYFAVDRIDDALTACRRVLELDPDDYSTAYRFARQLRLLGKLPEAAAVLTRAAERPGLKERLEIRVQIFFDLAGMQEQAGELDKAKKSLHEVLAVLDQPSALLEQGRYNRQEIDTQAAETWERLGRIHLRGKQIEQAVAAFAQAMKKDPPRSARLAFNLAEVHAAQGDAAKALEQIEQYLRSQPTGMEGYELRIRLQHELHQPQSEVVRSLEESAQRDANNQGLKLLLARECVKGRKIDEAERIYQKLLPSSPTAEVYRGLFELYKTLPQGGQKVLWLLDEALRQAAGEGEEDKNAADDPRQVARREEARAKAVQARAMLIVLRDDANLVERLLTAAKDAVPIGRPTPRSLGHTTRLTLANLAARTKKLQLAEDLYRGCLVNFSTRRRGSEHEIYLGLLTVLALQHKNAEIVKVCEKGLKTARDTNRVLFHFEAARAHMALGHVQEALTAIDFAVKNCGTRETTLTCRINRAALLSEAGKHEQGVAECRALLQEYNQSGDVHTIRSVLSSICSAAHQYDEAEKQLQLILEDDPDNATANNDLGYLWADQNRKLDEAETRIRRALELDRRQKRNGASKNLGLDGDRDNAAFVDSLGWVLFRKGDWSAARRELERAAALPTGDDDPVVWDHLGDVYFRLKKIDKAGEAWKRAIELYESGGRRRPDERYREIKEKLRNSP